VRSQLPLPELPSWPGGESSPDIVVRFGAVPSRLDDVISETPFLQIGASGTFLLSIDGVGVYHISGSEVVIAPRDTATDAELRLFLLGSVLGFICHKRGLFPLHASSVLIDGKAVAFSGPSGSGKSTIGAALLKQGYLLLSDDVCVIDVHAQECPVVRPTFPRLKLWQDSLDALGIDSNGLERNRPFQKKFHYRTAWVGDARPVPLAAIFFLEAASIGSGQKIQRIERLTESITTLHTEVFRLTAAKVMGQEQALLDAEVKIAQHVPVFRWCRSREFSRLEEEIASLMQSLQT